MSSVLRGLLQYDRKYSILERCQYLLRKSRIAQVLIAIFGLTIARQISWIFYRKLKKLPPGPIGYPFVGIFFHMANDPLYPAKVLKQYGPIVYAPLISSSVIILNDAALVKQILPQNQFLNRKSSFLYQGKWRAIFSVSTSTDHQTYPFFFESGESWVKRRKYATSVCAFFNFLTIFKIFVCIHFIIFRLCLGQ